MANQTFFRAALNRGEEGRRHSAPLCLSEYAFKASYRAVGKNICDLVSWPWNALWSGCSHQMQCFIFFTANIDTNPQQLNFTLQKNLYLAFRGKSELLCSLRRFNMLATQTCVQTSDPTDPLLVKWQLYTLVKAKKKLMKHRFCDTYHILWVWFSSNWGIFICQLSFYVTNPQIHRSSASHMRQTSL